MWVNIFPDCSEATGSKTFLEEARLKLCCNDSYVSSLLIDQQKREILQAVVHPELECSDGKGKSFTVITELIIRTC